MKIGELTCIEVITLLAALATPAGLAAQDNLALAMKSTQHHHYQLIVLGTLGGPQSYGDPGHGAANINNAGVAAGVADTNVSDPFYPNYNPVLSGLGSYPYVYHAFVTDGHTFTDLGGLPGGTSSTPSHITNNGLVAGGSLNGSIDPITGWPELNAVLWTDRQIINLGTLGGYESASAWANSQGQVAGDSTNTVPDPYSFLYLFFGGTSDGTQNRAFLWDERTGMRDLGTLGGPDASAYAMNERGQIVGQSYINDIPNPASGIPTIDPFLWEDGSMIDLGSLGGTIGLAGDINNRGQVIGNSNLPGDATQHGFLWDHGKLKDVGSLGGNWSAANALNEAGHIAGQSVAANGEYHAFFWQAGVITDLGPLPGFGDTSCIGAFGINSHDQVVGQAVQNFCAGPGAHAFLWENGDMVDLNQFVPPGSNLALTDVEKINDSGEVFGGAVLDSGESRAFLMIPCDEQHPSLEGCDYSLIDGNTAATGVSSSRGIQTAAPTAQNAPMFRGLANPMLRRFGRGLEPWYRAVAK
jgi:probable HAF family extracellular repeat protein